MVARLVHASRFDGALLVLDALLRTADDRLHSQEAAPAISEPKAQGILASDAKLPTCKVENG